MRSPRRAFDAAAARAAAAPCTYGEATPFYCETHRCGIAADGAIDPCLVPGCKHWGAGGDAAGRLAARRERERATLAARAEVVTDRLTRDAAELARIRRRLRALAKRMGGGDA
jgi:hypothetical protein